VGVTKPSQAGHAAERPGSDTYTQAMDAMKIELFFFDGCPGHAELRDRLPHLLEQASVKARIEEHRVDSEQGARRERFLGSPTLRVNGHDVDPSAATRRDYGIRCRLYPAENGLARIPPDGWITDAIEASAQARGS
jgi:hypothetical protein